MPKAITLDALKVLQAINAKGSFAAAADSLFKVPSALSYTMQKLETDLGLSLFDRRGQRAVLTAAGRLVLEDGLDILAATDRLEAKVHLLEGGWEPRLVIARDTIVPDNPLYRCVGEFCQLDRPVEIQVTEEALGGGWDALHTQRADIAIGLTGELPKGQYHVRQMGTLKFVFAVSSDHPLAQRKGQIDTQDIQPFPAIVVADSSRTLPSRNSGLVNCKQQIRVSNMAGKLSAQLQGVGIGYLPRHLAQAYLDSGHLVEKDFAVPRPETDIYFAWEKGKQGKALEWFCDTFANIDWFTC